MDRPTPQRHPAHAPPPQPGGPFAEDEDEAGEGEEPAGEDEEEDPEVRRLQEEHTKLMDCILEEVGLWWLWQLSRETVVATSIIAVQHHAQLKMEIVQGWLKPD